MNLKLFVIALLFTAITTKETDLSYINKIQRVPDTFTYFGDGELTWDLSEYYEGYNLGFVVYDTNMSISENVTV